MKLNLNIKFFESYKTRGKLFSIEGGLFAPKSENKSLNPNAVMLDLKGNTRIYPNLGLKNNSRTFSSMFYNFSSTRSQHLQNCF